MYLLMQTTNEAFCGTKGLALWIIITPYNNKSQEWFYLFTAMIVCGLHIENSFYKPAPRLFAFSVSIGN